MIFPSWIRTTRFASTAMELSWVIITMVFPSVFSCFKKSSTSLLVRESRAPVGSSARIRDGSPARALAMDTLCCWPPESWLGIFLHFSFRPTRSRDAMARLWRSSLPTPA